MVISPRGEGPASTLTRPTISQSHDITKGNVTLFHQISDPDFHGALELGQTSCFPYKYMHTEKRFFWASGADIESS